MIVKTFEFLDILRQTLLGRALHISDHAVERINQRKNLTVIDYRICYGCGGNKHRQKLYETQKCGRFFLVKLAQLIEIQKDWSCERSSGKHINDDRYESRGPRATASPRDRVARALSEKEKNEEIIFETFRNIHRTAVVLPRN